MPVVENPVLEEIDESVPMLDEVAGRQERQEREARLEHLGTVRAEPPAAPNDPFNEIDFGSYFQDYLDPGYRTQPEYEESERPSFENFLSQPTTLSDHLAWQLGALTLDSRARAGRRLRSWKFGRRRLSDGIRRRASPGCQALSCRSRTRRRCSARSCSTRIDLVQSLDPVESPQETCVSA